MSTPIRDSGLEVFSVVVDAQGGIAQLEDDDQYHAIAADFGELFSDLDQQAADRGVTKIPVVTGYGDDMAMPRPRPIMVATTGALVAPDDPDAFMKAFEANEGYDGEYTDVSLAQLGAMLTELNESDAEHQWVPGFILITPDRKLVDLAYALHKGWIK